MRQDSSPREHDGPRRRAARRDARRGEWTGFAGPEGAGKPPLDQGIDSMIDKLIHGSLSTRLLVFILAVFLAGGGWYAYRNLTIEAFPDPTDTQVQIITLFPGQPTEEV